MRGIGHADTLSAVALDHATHPRHHGALAEYDGHACLTGPCGDTMEMWLTSRNGIVAGVSFVTTGCHPSLASGSMAATLAEGKLIEDAAAVSQDEVLRSLGGLPPEHEHCALLATDTLKAACEDCLTRQMRG